MSCCGTAGSSPPSRSTPTWANQWASRWWKVAHGHGRRRFEPCGWSRARVPVGGTDAAGAGSRLPSKDSVYRLAGGGPSDLWAFGLAARHWDGTRWSTVPRPTGADPKTNAPVSTWAGAGRAAIPSHSIRRVPCSAPTMLASSRLAACVAGSPGSRSAATSSGCGRSPSWSVRSLALESRPLGGLANGERIRA